MQEPLPPSSKETGIRQAPFLESGHACLLQVSGSRSTIWGSLRASLKPGGGCSPVSPKKGLDHDGFIYTHLSSRPSPPHASPAVPAARAVPLAAASLIHTAHMFQIISSGKPSLSSVRVYVCVCVCVCVCVLARVCARVLPCSTPFLNQRSQEDGAGQGGSVMSKAHWQALFCEGGP